MIRPNRTGALTLLAASLLLATSLPFAQPAPPETAQLLVSAFYPGPLLPGGPEECVRVANAGEQPADLAGYSLSDVFGATAGRAHVARGKGARRDLVFPEGSPATRLAPGEEIVIARDAGAYARQFGEKPDFELGEDARFPENDPEVPDILAVGGRRTRRGERQTWPRWPASGGDVIALCAPGGEIVDLVVWDGRSQGPDPKLLAALRAYERAHDLPLGALWTGPGLAPRGELASPYGPRTRVFARDRDTQGRLLADTNSYRDWDSGASLLPLGVDPTHRIEMAGQSRFLARAHDERALVTMSAGPDCIHEALVGAWARAEREIRVSVYYFDELSLLPPLLAAIERGVDVVLFLEGSTVGVKGGFSDATRHIARRIEEHGRERSGLSSRGLGRVYWMRSDAKAGIADRYLYDHSKYCLIDGRTLIVGSENYGPTGHPVDPSYGNRGWEIQIATPPDAPPLGVVQDALAVWDDDCDPARHEDVIRYSDEPASLDPETGRGRYGPPARDFDPGAAPPPRAGRYVPIARPETVEVEGRFELVLSPDNSLNEESGILGAIARAEREILVQHMDLRLWWGSRVDTIRRSPTTTPNLLLQALVQAARRGVRLRVLLDCSRFNCDLVEQSKDRKRDNNDDTVAWLRQLAQKEGLDIEARLLDVRSPEDHEDADPEDAGYAKIHNKGLIIDGHTVLVSSINGSENSFKGNREMGVLVTAPPVAAYYGELFWYDFTTIAAPRALRGGPGALPAAALGEDEERVGATLSGLAPETDYHLRVTAHDSDETDRDPLDRSILYGPHESAFSPEIVVRSSRKGQLHASWEANRSEARQGDLAGYRLYFGLRSGASASTPGDAARRGLYEGRSSKHGASPLLVPASPSTE